jgi:hypothetical protein
MSNLLHKHGGKIVVLTAMEHSTDRGVADWEWRGVVQWDDGSVSNDAHISPICLCSDGTAVGDDQVRLMSERLVDYLERNGVWHDDKHKRDGRVYRWTPHKPSGRESLT